MKKIAFYINKATLPNRDYSELVHGNPGLPGSEYEFLLVSQLLDRRNNGLEIFLLVNFEGSFPHSHVWRVTDLESSCTICLEQGISTLVVDIKYFEKTVMDRYPQLKYIIWAHNYMTIKQLDLFNEMESIKRVVCVGREFMELYRDHPCSWKSSYIYNIFPIREKEYYKRLIRIEKNHNVVYMGCLIEEKGFHILAKAWKTILEGVPDAQLYVIGNGRLYDPNAELGKYGVASPEYESKFMSYLVDDEGKVLDSVHFLGILGEEKYDILSKCKVGVPNPSGLTETFCITGVEMQLYGNTVTSVFVPAFLDTFTNPQYIYRGVQDIARYVVNALLQESADYNKTYDFIQERFGVQKNIRRWEKLLWGNLPLEPISQYHYHLKGLKNVLLYVKRMMPILNRIPLVEQFYNWHYYRTNQREKILFK